MPEYPDDQAHTSAATSSSTVEGRKRKQQAQQARQLLSCKKCRERKVKCDRTKPCSACCARGQPKDCEFVAEGGDYAPIQQSYELRKLRAENLRLKERLRAWNLSIEEDDSDLAASPDSHPGDRPHSAQRRRSAKQKRFQGSEWQDSIYFGSPSITNVISDFAAVNSAHNSASLAYLMPRGPILFATRDLPSHPFPTIFPAAPEECVPKLISLLPKKDELFTCLQSFEARVNLSSFPHVPFEITRSEMERFLSDVDRNASVCPDMLALLFAALALGGQHSVWEKAGRQWKTNAVLSELKKGDVFMAAAMQALRLASYMHKPSLLGIQALIMIGPYLSNSGRFLDAWTLFGTTIRLAHSIGLHRHPKHLDPAPPTQRECSVHQALWWWMLHMDEQYSMTLGRPLGISGIGDCQPPEDLSTAPHILRFGEFVNRFTLLARQILGSERLTNARIDEYTDELRSLQDTVPELLQFKTSWLEETIELPEVPLSVKAAVYFCKSHTYMILLNRQRTDENCLQSSSAPTKSPASKFHAVNRASSSHSSPGMSLLAPLRGRSLVVASSEQILDAFVFLYQKIPAALVSWTIAQQAFNACMLLLLDALELRKETTGAISVEKALVIFLAMEKIHKLAPLAIRRISWGLNQLRDITQGNMDSTQTKQEHDPQADKLSLGSEAVHSSNKGYGDTVMGATGMYLLDDPGLQGCAHEAFAPFRWDATVSEPAAFAKLEDEPPIAGTTVDHMREMSNKPFPTERSHQARSLEGVQSRWRSQASHSAPYIDSTSPLSSSQPPTPKPPRSHTSSADSLSQLKYPLHEAAQNDYRPLVTPQWHAQFRPPTRGEPSQRAPVTVSQEAAMRMQHTAMFSGHYPNTTMQQRHNSCPTIPQQFTRPPATSGMAYSPSYLPEVQHGIALGTEASEFMDIPGQNSLPFAQDIVAEDLIDTRTTHPSWSTNATEWPHSSNSHSPPTQSGSIDPFQRMDHSFPH